ncbi:MAG: di-heme oxidoredictase family protein [Rikenellaceae bacterium]
MRKVLNTKLSLLIIATSLLGACSYDTSLSEEELLEQELNPLGLADEYFTGGLMGTTTINGVFCFEQATYSVSSMGLDSDFLHGEAFFEDYFSSERNEGYPMSGRGPLYIRESCIGCHPGYGHGKRMGNLGEDVTFDTSNSGNGYLLVVYNSGADKDFGDASSTITDGRIDGPTWTDATSDNAYVAELTGMPQTRSATPFPEPIDESQIQIKWVKYVDEHDNKYSDGESYELIYPEVTIPSDAIYGVNSGYFDNLNSESKYEVRLEATIGIYGTGLIDAITEEDIDAESEAQADKSWGGRRGASITQLDGSTRKGRYTYGLTRGTLQHGPGSNALWNITNVTRETSNKLYRSNYVTAAYANAVCEDVDVMTSLMNDSHYGEFLVSDDDPSSTASKNEVYNYLLWNNAYPTEKLTSTTYLDHLDDATQRDAELDLDSYTQFMVWHRGLAVPSARNIDDEDFIRGKELFYSEELACTACHRPSWTTGSDDYVGDADMAGKLPKYPNQKIWPYSDFLQHNLGMVNNIRTGWCRTTPLWGRYLNLVANGESSHLHDMRARDYYEAIMWHNGQAKYSSDAFRELIKSDRDAVVKFLKSI